MTTDQNDPDGLSWRIAKAVQPEIYKALNHVSKLDHNHVRDMNVDRNRGRGTWWWAVKVADAVIAVLPELQDDEPEHGNPFGDVGEYLDPLTIRPTAERARAWLKDDPARYEDFWADEGGGA